MLLLTAGPFGELVANRLRLRGSIQSLPLYDSNGHLHELPREVSFIGVASWRPYPDLYEQLDQFCASRRIRWSSASLDGSVLICGPLSVPWAGGACYSCFRRRLLTHRAEPERMLAIEAAHAIDPLIGVRGSTPIIAQMAGTALMADAVAAGNQAGRVRIHNLISGTIEETKVVPIHACARCGAGHDGARRYVSHLKAQLDGERSE